MNEDIKEVLAYFEEYIRITDMHDSEPMLNWKDLKIVLDYITNLQKDLKYQKEAEQEYNEKHTKLMKKYRASQEKINKAINYLEQPYRDNFDFSKAQLLSILQGVGKDE